MGRLRAEEEDQDDEEDVNEDDDDDSDNSDDGDMDQDDDCKFLNSVLFLVAGRDYTGKAQFSPEQSFYYMPPKVCFPCAIQYDTKYHFLVNC